MGKGLIFVLCLLDGGVSMSYDGFDTMLVSAWRDTQEGLGPVIL